MNLGKPINWLVGGGSVLLVEVGAAVGFYHWIWEPPAPSLATLCMAAGAGIVLLKGQWASYIFQMAAEFPESLNRRGLKMGLEPIIHLLVFVGLFGSYGLVSSWSGLSKTVVLLGLSSVAVIAHLVAGEMLVRMTATPTDQHPSQQFRRLENWLEQQTRKLNMPDVQIKLAEISGIIGGARTSLTGQPTILLGRGALEHLSFQDLQALCAHELGHLHEGASRRRQVGWIGFAVVNFFMVAGLTSLLLPTGPGGGLAIALGVIIGGTLTLGVIWKWGLKQASRQSEYRADSIARRLGEGEALAGLLE